uniref:Uncharacterized protein n=1 Tax=Vibrio parahaemolyticus TaxID=670 RepID=B3IUT2_VIBPH|nr:hypothetical protein [Vibrio parahaemolyticus]
MRILLLELKLPQSLRKRSRFLFNATLCMSCFKSLTADEFLICENLLTINRTLQSPPLLPFCANPCIICQLLCSVYQDCFFERLVAKVRLKKNSYINKPNESGISEQWLTRNAAGR